MVSPYEICSHLPGVYRLQPQIAENTTGTSAHVRKHAMDIVISQVLQIHRPLGMVAYKTPIAHDGIDKRQQQLNISEVKNNAKIQAKLQGIPGVPRYFGSTSHGYYSEWIEGKSVNESRGRFIALPDAITFLKFAGRITSDALQRGIILRDIVPRNVINTHPHDTLLNSDNLHLVDFGKSYEAKKIRKEDSIESFKEESRQQDVAQTVLMGLLTEAMIERSMLEAFAKVIDEEFLPLHESSYYKFLVHNPEEYRKVTNRLGLFLTSLEPEELDRLSINKDARNVIKHCLMRTMYSGFPQQQQLSSLLKIMQNSCGYMLCDDGSIQNNYERMMSVEQFIKATQSL